MYLIFIVYKYKEFIFKINSNTIDFETLTFIYIVTNEVI